MGRRIGKYDILRTLGQGAMGEVYLANHPVIGREVAIKTILPGAARGEDAEGRFRREAEAAGQLNHPNLVTIFDFDKDQEVLFLVMEYVKGDDLEDLIKQRALSPPQFLELLAQVCDGLSHAHRHGIIHRDIKPANVRVVRDGRNLLAKVMDFGIARISDSSMTATGIVMGTVSYMAPEYIRDGHATAQSDLFAVGVMLYESLTGRKPFPGDNTTTILFKIVSETPPPIDMDGIHGISPSIRQVLDKALAKEPGERFQTADDLARALRACKDPTWSGSLDEATALLSRARPVAAPAPAPASASAPAAAATRLEPLPAQGATTVLPAPAATSVLPGSRPGGRSRAGLYAAAGVAALALAGGGGYLLLRPAAMPAAPVAPVAPATPVVSAPVVSAPVAAAPDPAPVPVAAPPAPAAPAKPAPAVPAPVKPVAAAPAPAPARPAAPAVAAKVPEPAAPAAAAPAPAPAEKPAEDPLKTIGKLIGSDPRQAVALLRPLAQAQPGSVEVQGNYLAALYRTGNAWDFERALTRAAAAGTTVKAMLAVPAFRSALADESRLQKAKPPAGVLPQDVMAKVLEGL